MRRKARAVTTIATILFCFCAAASADATSMPAATATAEPATDLATTSIVALIVSIRDAKDVATAATNYSKARAIDKDDTEVHDEYMKKMLTFGHPKIAAYPAMELKRLQAKNGTAWAVMGYNDAKKGKYLPAFLSTMRGMQLLPDNPGIQNNAGVLLAWYETRHLKPKLTADLKTVLSQNSAKWLEKAKYAEAYSKCKSQFAAREERMAKLKAEVTPAEEAAKAAARESSQATDRYRKYARAIAGLEDDMRDLRRAYERASRSSKTDTKTEKKRRKKLMAEVQSRIKPYKKKMESLEKASRSVRKEAAEKAQIFSKAKMALAKAKTALKAEESIKPSLTWIPPAVDGVITPEDPNPPNFAAHTGPTSKPSPLSLADVRLKMAKLLLQNKRADKAIAILEAIIKDYPDSKAANEAGELLKEHQSKEVGEL